MTPRSTYQRLLGYAGWLVVILILGFLILPAAVVTIAAFNDKAILSFPPQGLSLRWFEEFAASPPWVGAMIRSFGIGFATATITLVVGALAAIGVARTRGRPELTRTRVPTSPPASFWVSYPPRDVWRCRSAGSTEGGFAPRAPCSAWRCWPSGCRRSPTAWPRSAAPAASARRRCTSRCWPKWREIM